MTDEVKTLPDGRMNKNQAAKYIGVARGTLERYIRDGIGPRVTKLGGAVWFFKADIDAWIEAERDRSTS